MQRVSMWPTVQVAVWGLTSESQWCAESATPGQLCRDDHAQRMSYQRTFRKVVSRQSTVPEYRLSFGKRQSRGSSTRYNQGLCAHSGSHLAAIDSGWTANAEPARYQEFGVRGRHIDVTPRSGIVVS